MRFTSAKEVQEKIRSATSPEAVHEIVQQHEKLPANWSPNKAAQFAESVLRLKVEQHPELFDKLLYSNDYYVDRREHNESLAYAGHWDDQLFAQAWLRVRRQICQELFQGFVAHVFDGLDHTVSEFHAHHNIGNPRLDDPFAVLESEPSQLDGRQSFNELRWKLTIWIKTPSGNMPEYQESVSATDPEGSAKLRRWLEKKIPIMKRYAKMSQDLDTLLHELNQVIDEMSSSGDSGFRVEWIPSFDGPGKWEIELVDKAPSPGDRDLESDATTLDEPREWMNVDGELSADNTFLVRLVFWFEYARGESPEWVDRGELSVDFTEPDAMDRLKDWLRKEVKSLVADLHKWKNETD